MILRLIHILNNDGLIGCNNFLVAKEMKRCVLTVLNIRIIFGKYMGIKLIQI